MAHRRRHSISWCALRLLTGARVVACVGFTVAMTSCAYFTPGVQWEEAVTEVERTPAAMASSSSSSSSSAGQEAAGEHRPMSAAEYAAKFATDKACLSEATRQYTKAARNGLALLDACIARGNFARLPELLEGPWSSTFVKDPEMTRRCAAVVAQRGVDVEGDVHACAQAGMPLRTLEDAFIEPARASGALVVFRARVDDSAVASGRTKGKKKGTNASVRLLEYAVAEGDVDSSSTGRHVIASGSHGATLSTSRDSIVLARVDKIIDDADDGEPRALVDVLGAWPVGTAAVSAAASATAP